MECLIPRTIISKVSLHVYIRDTLTGAKIRSTTESVGILCFYLVTKCSCTFPATFQFFIKACPLSLLSLSLSFCYNENYMRRKDFLDLCQRARGFYLSCFIFFFWHKRNIFAKREKCIFILQGFI